MGACVSSAWFWPRMWDGSSGRVETFEICTCERKRQGGQPLGWRTVDAAKAGRARAKLRWGRSIGRSITAGHGTAVKGQVRVQSQSEVCLLNRCWVFVMSERKQAKADLLVRVRYSVPLPPVSRLNHFGLGQDVHLSRLLTCDHPATIPTSTAQHPNQSVTVWVL